MSDSSTFGERSIGILDSKILNGDGYNAFFIDAAVANGANSDIRFLTPAGIEIILFATIFGTGTADISLFEGGNITVGNALTAFNLRRSSSKTTGVTITEGPTVTTTGTEILGVRIPGTIKKDAIPFSASTAFPRILDVSTEHLVRYVNNSGGAEDISWILQWVELPVIT